MGTQIFLFLSQFYRPRQFRRITHQSHLLAIYNNSLSNGLRYTFGSLPEVFMSFFTTLVNCFTCLLSITP